jgi:hypothetical protein
VKPSKISTWPCSLGIILCVIAAFHFKPAYPFSISARAGVHDFSNDATRDFYGLAKGGTLSCAFYESRQFSIETTSGLFHSSVSYNGSNQILYVVPFTASFALSFSMDDSKWAPYIGMGIGGWYKREESPTTGRSFNYITYGYHFIGGLKYPISSALFLLIDMRNCLIMTDFKEEMNLSGMQTTVGVAYRPGG